MVSSAWMAKQLVSVALILVLVQAGYVTCCVEEERLALLELRGYMESCSKSTVWNDDIFMDMSDKNCCAWSVVSCESSGRVAELYLGTIDMSRDSESLLINPWLFNVTYLRPFTQLTSLDLSYNHISGLVDHDGSTKISTLKNLRSLDLNGNSLKAGKFSLGALNSLQDLSMSDCELNESILPGRELANLTELRSLDLSSNKYTCSFQDFWLCKLLPKLDELRLANNSFTGGMPSCLNNLTNLRVLDLSQNKLEGKFSLSTLADLSKLEELNLSENNLEVHTEDALWIPSFQLKILRLAGCRLDEPRGLVPSFLLHQHKINIIDLAHNDLVGPFPTWLWENSSQLANLTNHSHTKSYRSVFPLSTKTSLHVLDISFNKFQGELPRSIGFIFPSLLSLKAPSNQLEGDIPSSIGQMESLEILHLSSNNLSGELPRRLLTDCRSLRILRLSDNNLHGDITPDYMFLQYLNLLELANNGFGGEIKDALARSSELSVFDISNNSVVGQLPKWFGNFSSLTYFVASQNFLEGHIPAEFCELDLIYLDLSHNKFTGRIPSCSTLLSLQLRNNSFSGGILEVLSNSSNLETLDLRDNQISGSIPQWINKVLNLKVLILGGNNLLGRLPPQICELQNITILDLSHNGLSGGIPKCFANMSFGLKPITDLDSSWDISYSGGATGKYDKQESVEIRVKYQFLSYASGSNLTMSGLDLSCNKFSGTIPSQLGTLNHIHSLNVSHNLLAGSIPSSFSNMKQLESLDLSFNTLNGSIPFQLTDLNFLETFNVSYNNLVGRVPTTGQFAAFDERNYLGNPGLYGFPTDELRNTSKAVPHVDEEDVGDEGTGIDIVDFLWSFGMTSITMFLVTLVILRINPYWRRKWFEFADWHFLWWLPLP